MTAHRGMVLARLALPTWVEPTPGSRRASTADPAPWIRAPGVLTPWVLTPWVLTPWVLTPWVLTAASLVAVGVIVASPLLALVGPFAVGAAERVRGRLGHRRSRRQGDRSVIELVDQISQQLRAGTSLPAATETALAGADAGLRVRLAPARSASATGEGLADALRRVDTSGLVSLELLVTSLRLLLDNGGPAAISIDRVGETLRAGVAAREEAAAQAGQATASAALLAVLPLGFAFIVALAEPAAAHLYLATWTGAACVAASCVLSSLSWWWIDRVVHR